jgi:hypothetical protein
MQNVKNSGVTAQSDDRDDIYRAVVANLASLIEHIQTSLTMLEAAVAREATVAVQELAANVVVLDDVTPLYLKADVALKACDAGLGVALIFFGNRWRPSLACIIQPAAIIARTGPRPPCVPRSIDRLADGSVCRLLGSSFPARGNLPDAGAGRT